MRKFLFLFFILYSFWSSAQPQCDIQTPGIAVVPAIISVGQAANMSFTVFNNAGGTSCVYEANSVSVVISLPDTGVAFNGFVSPSTGVGPYFDWIYEPINNIVYGINHTPLGDAEGELDVTFSIIATALPSYPSSRLIPISIIQNPNGPIFPSNNPANDNGYTTVTIVAPLPIELKSFTGHSESCNSVLLQWETASEKNNDYMEVLRSDDGVDFISLGKVKGTNSAFGSQYSFSDEYNLIPDVVYYYKLKQIDFDGGFEYFNMLPVKYNCDDIDKTFSVHPNPTIDVINVSLLGYGRDNITLQLFDALGRLVDINYEIISHDENNFNTKVDMSSLNNGVYYLSVNNEGLMHKVIKIK